MPPRNHKNWLATPNVEYISSECYNNADIFAQEQERIFSKVWVPMCHISEMYKELDSTRCAELGLIDFLEYLTLVKFYCFFQIARQLFFTDIEHTNFQL